MFLKRIELQGFKTFVGRTVFELDRGVTAIVGPNGSGKSNLADAIRWALGEQSARLLRVRRAEDVIFAGHASRAPVGLAEATLVFDNSGGRLPIEAAEVSIGRRILRSGESDYLINRQRVRWRDLTDLLLRANIGTAGYAVIGQGMVDQTIGQRPEERRLLFEEAADVRRLYLKLDETKEHLGRTQEHLLRVGDLVAQLEPDLGRLEEQARRAEEYERLTKLLAELLGAWYGALWSRATAEVGRAKAALANSRQEAAVAAQAVAAAEARLQVLIAGLERDRQSLAGRREDLATARQDLVRLEATVAAAADQRRLLDRRRRELDEELAALAADRERHQRQAERARRRAEALAAQEQEAADRVAGLEAIAGRLSGETAAAERHLREVEGERLRRQAESNAVRGDIDRLRGREQRLAAEIAAVEAQLAAGETRAQELAAAAVAGARRLDEQRRVAAVAALALDAARRRRDEARAALAAAEEGRTLAEREARSLAERLADLDRRAGQGGLYPGVRVILAFAGGGEIAATARPDGCDGGLALASRGDRKRSIGGDGLGRGAPGGRPGGNAVGSPLRGIVGLVSQIVQAPAELEVAIEAALGGRLQDVVVERWEDAEAAIELLKREQAGRATFLPLDTVRAGRVVDVAVKDGVVGTAARLVGAEPRFQTVVDLLLGGIVVVRDLAAARRLLRQGVADGSGAGVDAGRRPQQIVTLAGEIVRPGGAVTGGVNPRAAAGGLLALERERREGGERLAAAQRRAAEAASRAERLRQDDRRAGEEAAVAEEAERQTRRALRALDDETARAERQAVLARQDGDGFVRTLARLQGEQAELVAAQRQLAERLAGLDGEAAPSAAANEARARLELLAERREETRKQLADLHSAIAGLAAEARQRVAEAGGEETAARRVEEQVEAKRGRRDETDAEATALAGAAELQTAKQTGLAGAVAGLEAEVRALLAAVAAADRERKTAEAELAERRAARARAESAAGSARVEIERAQAGQEALLDRMAADGFTPRLPGGDAAVGQQLVLLPAELPFAGEGLAAPGLPSEPGREETERRGSAGRTVVDPDPEALRRRIERVRAQIRGLGPVNPSAGADYASARERHAFLTQQIADLRATDRQLRQGIADLEGMIARQFRQAFGQIDAEFRRTFATLFGGGTARLVLTAPEDVGATGVEIEAQPPGKRLQALPILSGGEKALTAVALLFALLKVNPTPFCVLDEVDAALDEANVGRFAGLLRQLAGATQFIIITHNRVTMERADALYGISLSAGGQSVPVSLRLEDPGGL